MSPADARLAALAPALEDVERALGRDRSHVIASGGSGAEHSLFLQAVPARLAAPLRAVSVHLSGAGVAQVAARILRGLGREPGPHAEEELRILAADLQAGDRVLVLLIDDAASLPPEVLGRLGSLAAAARRHLLLVLAMGAREGEEADVAAVVRALGFGAEKIELGPTAERAPASPPRAPAPAAAPPAAPAVRPPRLEPDATPSHVSRPLPVRAETPASPAARRARLRPGRALVPAAAAGGLALLALLGLHDGIAERVSATPRELPPVGTRPVAFLATEQEPARTAAPAEPAVTPAATAPPEPVAESKPPAPPEPVAEKKLPPPQRAVRTVSVSLNARPWARIEVDGRDVGFTPLAGLRLSQGPHRFRAQLADGRVIERTVRIDSGSNRVVFP
jgi:hypothetical protein